MAAKCGFCGLANRPEVKFCENCGNPLPAIPEFVQEQIPKNNLVCTVCGTPLRPDTIFCERCGATLPVLGGSNQSLPPPPVRNSILRDGIVRPKKTRVGLISVIVIIGVLVIVGGVLVLDQIAGTYTTWQ
jgi:uncharacterized membrane protein YvbJ